jgi:hypothetical protein
MRASTGCPATSPRRARQIDAPWSRRSAGAHQERGSWRAVGLGDRIGTNILGGEQQHRAISPPSGDGVGVVHNTQGQQQSAAPRGEGSFGGDTAVLFRPGRPEEEETKKTNRTQSSVLGCMFVSKHHRPRPGTRPNSNQKAQGSHTQSRRRGACKARHKGPRGAEIVGCDIDDASCGGACVRECAWGSSPNKLSLAVSQQPTARPRRLDLSHSSPLGRSQHARGSQETREGSSRSRSRSWDGRRRNADARHRA